LSIAQIVVPLALENAMILNADSSGRCIPDGRFLERATIAAGSAVLTDADRNLRATDVGKNIAIPGAADLDAKIVQLVDQKKVDDASMVAGTTTLTAPLPPGQGFRDFNRGQRITVAGAGPGGTTLVSDVAIVDPDGTKLTLADAAATTVAHAVAILNRRDLVGLDNHARATVGNVTVDLPGRTVSDAQMTVGSRGLQSPTAGFSSVDLCKEVSIANAGLLVTTIQTVQSTTQVSLAVAALRAVSGGTADIWRTDSRPAFEQLLASLDGLDVEGAEIRFGPGVYDFSRSPQAGAAAAIALRGLRNLTIRGAGPGATVLRLMPDQDLQLPDTHVIHAFDCRNLTLGDLSVHGAYLTLAHVNEQMHGILINQDSEEVLVERVRVFQSAGDGIRLLGEPGHKVRKVWVQGCRLIQNKRTGIGFQREVEFVWIRDCYIEAKPPATDACIHFEPTGGVAPTDVVIDGNVLVHGTDATAATFSGQTGTTNPTQRVKFINNTVQGGGIGAVNAQDVTVANNTIVAGEQGPVVIFRGDCSGLRLSSNKIVAPAGVRAAVNIANLGNFASSGVWIEANHIEAAGGPGIAINNPGGHFEIRGNRLFGGGFAVIGVSVNLEPPLPRLDFKLADNTIANFRGGGIQLSTTNSSARFEGVAIHGNNIYVDVPGPGSPFGISFHKPGQGTDRWLLGAVVSGNMLDTLPTKIDRDQATVPFIAIGGNLGDGTIFEGPGSPEGIVAATVGSLFLRTDAGVNTALYLKQSGTADTGWVEMRRIGQ
jgi:Right handed beta helix region